MEASAFLELLAELAPLELAEEWDNVGLLVSPVVPQSVKRVFLTVDLTERVLDEALEWGASAIVAYHPPVFSGLKRIVPGERVGRLVLRVVGANVCVYSPHTALDSVPGGVNDWLSEAFEVRASQAIVPALNGALGAGQGRFVELREAVSLARAVELVKGHLGLVHLRVAEPATVSEIRTVALCAGAGGSVVTKVRADLYLSGEMRHHDVLRLAEQGASVILTEHSNSERGYLEAFKKRIEEKAPGLSLRVSRLDRDPLVIR